MKFKHALLLVSDINRSRMFYTGLLKQKIIHDFGNHITFEGGLAIHKAEHYQKMTGKTFARLPKDYHCAVYFETHDIIKDYDAMVKADVTILHPIEIQPWNQQVFRCFDPDNHLIEIGESMEQVIIRLRDMGKDISEIIKMTHLSQDYVDLVLDRKYGDRQILKS